MIIDNSISQNILEDFKKFENNNKDKNIRKRKNWKNAYEDENVKYNTLNAKYNILFQEHDNLVNKFNYLNKYVNIINFLNINGIENINELENKINESLSIENNILKDKINENQKITYLSNNFISHNKLDEEFIKFKENIILQDRNNKKIELRKKFNDKILKSKFITFCNYLYNNKDNIKIKREIKIKNLENKMKKNIIKSKVVNILRKLKENQLKIDKTLDKIKHNRNKINFDNKKIQESALDSNRSMMKFLSDLYEEKIINKKLSNKDFMIAVNEFHSDRNITRMLHLCKINYLLRKNEIVWNSNIIFKHIYSFQYIKEYQIEYLINKISKIINNY